MTKGGGFETSALPPLSLSIVRAEAAPQAVFSSSVRQLPIRRSMVSASCCLKYLAAPDESRRVHECAIVNVTRVRSWATPVGHGEPRAARGVAIFTRGEL